MMLDDNIVAVSPSSTYRVLNNTGRLDRRVVPPKQERHRLHSINEKAQQRCNLSVVKSEVGMRSGPSRGSAPFHYDFGTMR
jgi:hypothetical protein